MNDPTHSYVLGAPVSGNDMFRNVPARFLPPADRAATYYFPIPWMHTAIHAPGLNAGFELLGRRLADTPEAAHRVGIHDETRGLELTFGEIWENANRLANSLRALGLQPGERVLYRFGEVADAAVTKLAILIAGGIAIPSGLQDGPGELAYVLADAEVSIVVAQDARLNIVDEAVAQPGSSTVRAVVVSPAAPAGSSHLSFGELVATGSPEVDIAATAPLDAASIYYTGGTTGRPKGVIYTHFHEAHQPTDMAIWSTRRPRGDDVWMTHAPLGHAFGNMEKINYPLRALIPTVYKDRPTGADCLELLIRHRVTYFAGIAAMYARILDAMGDSTPELSLRLAKAGGEGLTQELCDRWLQVCPAAPLANSYGCVTTQSTLITSMIAGRKVGPAASIGLPIPGVEVAIRTADGALLPEAPGLTGRLAFRGPVGPTYWTNLNPTLPELMKADQQDGWHLSDDEVAIDDDGWFYFLSRVHDMMRISGRNVAAVEVEEVLKLHPDVADAAVIALPMPDHTAVIKAFICLRPECPDDGDALRENIRDFAKSKMSLYKAPRIIAFVPELPRDHLGKLRRKALNANPIT
ncbi:class I adenylate-forming enzyme family protein [Nocardia tengchongensis]|uniref:class I adenylate-forming enzyme family protein n=1 Tax=Nocardia tengchongensis TaxID=2055889 RepID=UPI0036D113CC